jgi:hypothetical protein
MDEKMRGKFSRWGIGLVFLMVMVPACIQPKKRVLVPVSLPRQSADETSDAALIASISFPPSPPVPLPPAQPLPPPVKPAPKRSHVSKAVPKEAPGTDETVAAPSAPANSSPLQLTPDIPEKEKQELKYKTAQELKSAEGLLAILIRQRDQSTLSLEQKTTISTIQDFMEKSKDASKRGDYYQAYAMAQKANILAASLEKN